MKKTFTRRLQSWSLSAILLSAWTLSLYADPIPVRHEQGTLHGFLEMRSEDHHVIASGDNLQTVHGNQVTSRTVFRFKDGSVDDETTIYSQSRTLQLISDHRVQKGPSFPHPMDVRIDAHSGQITVRTVGKDGRVQEKIDHLDLPPDLSNGMVPAIIENLRSDTSRDTVSMIVTTPKPRLVKLIISRVGDEPFLVGGSPRKADHFEIKVDLGGIVGTLAPLVGKAPPDVQLWSVGGEAPCFLKEIGPLYPEGPMFTIQLAGPVWPDKSASGQ